MLICLLPAFLSPGPKACTAGFCSPSITAVPIHIPRTAQLLRLPRLGSQSLGKARWKVVPELSPHEGAAAVGPCVGLPSCHNTGTSVCTVSLFPAWWNAFKKSQQEGFSEPDLPGFIAALRCFCLHGAVGLCKHRNWHRGLQVNQGLMLIVEGMGFGAASSNHISPSHSSRVTLDARFKFWKPFVLCEARIMQLSLFRVPISKIDKSLIPQCLGNCL